MIHVRRALDSRYSNLTNSANDQYQHYEIHPAYTLAIS